MKNNMIIATVTIVMVVLAIVLSSMYINNDIVEKSKTKSTKSAVIMHKLIEIDLMTCEECEMTISEAGSKVDGVTKISASSPNGQAIVTYDSGKTDIKSIMKAIRETGYKPVSSKDVAADYSFETQNKQSTMKCGGEMKCGAGKCGSN